MTSLSSNSTRRPRSVIVTGGASGLGKSMSAHFAALGDAVTILDVNVSLGAAVTDELNNNNSNNNDARGRGRVGFRKCDISSWEEQKEAFRDVWAREGRVDVVVANAGVSEGGRSWVVPPAEGLEGELEGNGDGELLEAPRLRVLDVNLVGNVYSVKLAQHYMRRNAPDATTGFRGSIICTASNAGLYPFPLQPLYAASKFAIVGLVRSLGPVYAQPHIGIRINALAPAVLETNISGGARVFDDMVITPPSTLIKGVERLLNDTSLNGQIVEIHGESVTLRPPHDVVDEDSRHNLEVFAGLASGRDFA